MRTTKKKLDKRKRVYVAEKAIDICLKSFRYFHEQSECLYAEKHPNPDIDHCKYYNHNGTCELQDQP